MKNIRIIFCQYLLRLILWIMPNNKESYTHLNIEFGGVGGVVGGGDESIVNDYDQWAGSWAVKRAEAREQ